MRTPPSGGVRELVIWEGIYMAIHEECGVIGVYDPAGDCARTAYYGLYALQHRGQEACGIATINNREWMLHRRLSGQCVKINAM